MCCDAPETDAIAQIPSGQARFRFRHPFHFLLQKEREMKTRRRGRFFPLVSQTRFKLV